eukprot:4701396-Lingulodinium_polyedra.AAC.1
MECASVRFASRCGGERWIQPHGVRKRAVCEPLQRRTVALTASLRSAWKMLHNDAVESTVCRHGGS